MSVFKVNFMSTPVTPHVYCQLFVADGPERTWALCGNLTMRKAEFADFRYLTSESERFVFEDVTMP